MIVGLTGGSGSGKSVVLKIFKTLGFASYSSDEAAKKVYFIPHIRQQVESLLGTESYQGQQLNRDYIRHKIFNNVALLHQLNAIIHPAVRQDFLLFCQHHPGTIIQESALLFETGLNAQCDQVIVVTAEDALRIKRLISRDGLSEEEILKRFESQWPESKKIDHANFVIYNNEKDRLLPQVLEIFHSLSHAKT